MVFAVNPIKKLNFTRINPSPKGTFRYPDVLLSVFKQEDFPTTADSGSMPWQVDVRPLFGGSGGGGCFKNKEAV